MTKSNKKETIYKHVIVSEENYLRLKMLGYAGDSLNDVLTGILKNRKRSYIKTLELAALILM